MPTNRAQALAALAAGKTLTSEQANALGYNFDRGDSSVASTAPIVRSVEFTTHCLAVATAEARVRFKGEIEML